MTSFCSEPENSFRILPSTVLGALSTVNHSWHPSWNVFIVFGDGNYKDSSSSSSQKYIIRHIKTVLNSIFTSILPASLLSKHCLHHVGAPILLWLYQPPLTLPCRHASTLCNVFPSKVSFLYSSLIFHVHSHRFLGVASRNFLAVRTSSPAGVLLKAKIIKRGSSSLPPDHSQHLSKHIPSYCPTLVS